MVAASNPTTPARSPLTATSNRRRSTRSMTAPATTPNTTHGMRWAKTAIATANGSRVIAATNSGPAASRTPSASPVSVAADHRTRKLRPSDAGSSASRTIAGSAGRAGQADTAVGHVDVRRQRGGVRVGEEAEPRPPWRCPVAARPPRPPTTVRPPPPRAGSPSRCRSGSRAHRRPARRAPRPRTRELWEGVGERGDHEARARLTERAGREHPFGRGGKRHRDLVVGSHAPPALVARRSDHDRARR
jgi:hypothetical protein